MRHALQRSSIVALGLVIVTLFALLETRPQSVVRASFTLVGIVDCGQRSGRDCASSTTITIISDDSGTRQPYTIDLSWVKDKLPGRFEQDQQVRIEIERLPDGTLMALRVIDLNDRKGTHRDDEGPRPTSTDDDEDKEDDPIEITGGETCVPATVTATVLGTTTRTSSTDTTLTTTTTTTATGTATVTVSIVAITTTNTSSPCGTTTVTSTALSVSDTTTTNTVVTTATTTATTVTTTTTTSAFCRMPLGGPIDEDDVVEACAGGSSSGPDWLESMAPVWQPITGWWNTVAAVMRSGT